MKYKTFQVNSSPEIEKAYDEWVKSLRRKNEDMLPESAYSRSMFLKAVIKFWYDENTFTLGEGYFKR